MTVLVFRESEKPISKSLENLSVAPVDWNILLYTSTRVLFGVH